MGSVNLKMSTDLFSSGVTVKSDKFSGVYCVMSTNLFLNSDFHRDLSGFYVNGGNFRMCVLCDDEIIAEVEPGETSEVLLHDLNGNVQLVIAGESADFEVTLDPLFCEEFGITAGN